MTMKTLFLILFVALGCTAQPVGVDGQAAPVAAANDAGVFTDPASYAGRTVHVEAIFQGYRVADCRFAPGARAAALTRSDWLVRHEVNCLYVTGATAAGRDGRLDLRAKVIDGGDGKFLLQMIEAKPLDK